MHRLRGELAAAEQAYRDASRHGREPQPGLALMRLAQGNGEAATAAIRRALDEAGERPQRARLLPAYVEIMLAVGDAEAARGPCAELERIAEGQEDGMLGAMAAHARGALDLATGDARAALVALRRAARAGSSSRRPTRPRGRGRSSPWPAARWGTTTRPRSSSRRPAASSPGSERRPIWRASRR